MYLNNKLVFLAGSTGLVGSNIMNYILNHYPTTKIRAAYYKHTKPFIKHKRIDYVYGELKSGKDCRRMVKGCDCAIMAAANTSGLAITVTHPCEQVNDNTMMNVQMLSAFYYEGIRRVIYIGSATLYQEFEGHIKEDKLDFSKDPYSVYFGIGWVVRFIEKLCKFWHDQFGMGILIARAANIFGPYAKFDPLTSNFIPAIIRKAIDKMEPFEVWGNPDVTRDVIYSDDFARAIVMMLNNDKIKFDIFNIGSGVETNVREVVNLALKYAGHKPSEIRYIPDKPTAIKFRVLDCSKAKEMLGWQPQYTVEEGIKRTTEWWIGNRRWWKK